MLRTRDALQTWALAVLLALAGAACRQGGEDPDQAAADSAAAEPLPPSVRAPVELGPDEKLAQAVRAAMLQAPALARQNVRIAVVQGQVFLTGEVDAPHLRDEAVAVAGEVTGVRSVQSKINVRRR